MAHLIDAENTTEGLIITTEGARALSPLRAFDDLAPMPRAEAIALRDYLLACRAHGRILPLMFKAGRGSVSHSQLSPQPMGVRRVRVSAPVLALLPAGGGA
jgi:hypothetical protein